MTPAQGRPMRRFLHISDTHFGKVFGHRGEPLLDARVRDWWAVHRALDGFLGHTYDALHDLKTLHRDLLQPTILMTGDLTRIGAGEEARVGRMFFEQTTFAGIPSTGLGLSAGWLKRSIPGNHDHWPAKEPVAPNFLCMVGKQPPGNALDVCLWKKAMFPRTIRLKVGEADLLLCLLNTDDDVRARSLERVRAIGAFAAQCKQAQNRFTLCDGDRRLES